MRVHVISDTIQEFNGERFYLCGNYFQHNGKRLHRAVWEYHFGPVPDGCDIHHIDGDRGHNDAENLACMARTEHHKHHTNTQEFLDHAKNMWKKFDRPPLRGMVPMLGRNGTAHKEN